LALLYDIAGRPQDLAEITTDMCKGASGRVDREFEFSSKKNKVHRTVYLSKRTVNLANTFIKANGLKLGERLFNKPDKNI